MFFLRSALKNGLDEANTNLWALICRPSSQTRVTSANPLSFLNSLNEEVIISLKSFRWGQSFSEVAISWVGLWRTNSKQIKRVILLEYTQIFGTLWHPRPKTSDAHLVDRPTQLICIWIFSCPQTNTKDKYKYNLLLLTLQPRSIFSFRVILRRCSL